LLNINILTIPKDPTQLDVEDREGELEETLDLRIILYIKHVIQTMIQFPRKIFNENVSG
jgi:hypothetical protein